MAKKPITQNSVDVNNIQNLPDLVVGQAVSLKTTFDKTGADTKTYINNTLITELNGNDGSFKIGHNSTNITANNVNEALEEVNAKDTANVKVTGNQTIAGIKTLTSSPIVPTPTTDMQASTKKYVDDREVAIELDFNTKDSQNVKITGNQTINGIKTFVSSPIVPLPTTTFQSVPKGYVDYENLKDVHLTGSQFIEGVKEFASSPVVPTPTTNNQASNKTYVDATVLNATMAVLPEGAVTDIYLSDTAGQIKDRFLLHLNAELPHIIDIDGIPYKYGFKQENGFVQFIYEEVI